MRDGFADDVRWGLRTGGRLALACLAISFVLFLVQGPSSWRSPDGADYLRVFWIYFGFGVTSGGFLGVFRPFSQSRFGSTFMGAVIGAIGFILVLFADRGTVIAPLAQSAQMIWPLGALAGGLFGWNTWNRRHSADGGDSSQVL
jgi:hypothetical protein